MRDRCAGSVALEGSRTAADVTALFELGMITAVLECSAVDIEETGTDGNDGNDTSIVGFGGGGIDIVGGGRFGTENCTINGKSSDTNCCVGVGANRKECHRRTHSIRRMVLATATRSALIGAAANAEVTSNVKATTASAQTPTIAAATTRTPRNRTPIKMTVGTTTIATTKNSRNRKKR